MESGSVKKHEKYRAARRAKGLCISCDSPLFPGCKNFCERHKKINDSYAVIWRNKVKRSHALLQMIQKHRLSITWNETSRKFIIGRGPEITSKSEWQRLLRATGTLATSEKLTDALEKAAKLYE